MSYMTGFFSPRQSIWASTGFPSMPTVAVDIISFLKACLVIEFRKWTYPVRKAHSLHLHCTHFVVV